MKLIINTQIKENYGAHDWDGEGACPQYWKFKGGNTYVVRGITPAQAMKIGDTGIPTLTKLVEESNEYFQEYILDWEIRDDSESDGCQGWENPIEFHWGGDRWLAVQEEENGEYGYMRSEIVRTRKTWIPQEGGEQAHYRCEYTMEDGQKVLHKDLAAWFDQKEAA